jgi:hypothetical protein
MQRQLMTKNLKERVKYEMAIRGIKPAEMAVVVGLAQRTFYARLACPSRFTLGEVEAMAQRMHLEPGELLFGSLSQG